MDHIFMLFVFPQKFHADLHMGAFHLMIDRLPDIMQQTGAPRDSGIGAQLDGHDSRQMGYLHRMLEDILAITCPILQPAQHFHQFWVEPMHIRIECRLFAGLTNGCIHLFAGFLHHFFDACRMNPSVRNQLL